MNVPKNQRPERWVDFWVGDSKYPGFMHRSFNVRLGRVGDHSPEMKKASRLSKEAWEAYKAEHPDADPKVDYPTFLPERVVTARHLELSLHARWGKQLLALRPEIEWHRQQVIYVAPKAES